ncbi:hypothetical protein E1211_09230 [Micromonospora sp. 15K316]|uniref:Rv0361 family membrane protein n=1 Tax=Micromonospora sp. 15K316 TaxID=2530376 RepID=UPI00104E9CA5|nr:hypothetical protein [Micromonospora sp. 15K316]TDC37802.1 hypothetical protein E1211_09230 [Micromonospora sp. 15K316]
MQPPAGSQVSRVPAQRPPSEQLPPVPVAPAPERPRHRLRTVLTVVGGVLALLCLGGAVTGYVLYDRATTPDRSAPDVVVASYIQAFLNERDDIKAEQFLCRDGGNLDAARSLRRELEQREANFDVVVRVRWGPLTQVKEENGESVLTTLTISGSANGQARSSRREDWSFRLVDEDGWRVCGAQKLQ